MEENLCEYAKPVYFLDNLVILCEGNLCDGKYKKTIHVDGEPKNICLINGLLNNEVREISLIKKMND